MSLLDRLEVPEAQSRASTRPTDRPRVAASSAVPAADHPAADDQDVQFVVGHPGDRVLAARPGTVPLGPYPRLESVFRLIQNRPLLGGHADVREAQELNVSGFLSAPPVPGGTPPELDQPRLTRVQFQPELREPAAQIVQEPLGVLPVLKPDDEVVREPDDDHITVREPVPPPVGPQVQDVVQVHVGEQRRNRCPLR